MLLRFFFIGFILFTQILLAQTPAQGLQHYLSQFQTLSANFSQTVINPDRVVLQKSQGNLVIQRPGKFRWETRQPLSQLIVTNGEILWIYDKDLQQVTIRKLDKSVGQIPMLLLTHPETDLSHTFDILSGRQPKIPYSLQSFKLIPKANHASFQYVTLTFKNSKLVQMEILNALQQKTIIDFSDVQLNVPLDSSLFVFQIPKGVETVKM
ncbi:MAG: outer membrane lipoprotein chaperone LolA [Gammaproteobacteria bacterium]|nr:outer membrane lipoprotein chaperone LolA [Gammaproteobacteria bacterium]